MTEIQIFSRREGASAIGDPVLSIGLVLALNLYLILSDD